MIRTERLAAPLRRAGVAALAAAAIAPFALAQTNVRMETQPPQGATEFTLGQQGDVEQLNYARPQRLRICNRSGDSAATPVPVAYPLDNPEPLSERPIPIGGPTAVALLVTYDGQRTAVEPGHCVRVRAEHLQIRARQNLPAHNTLTGWIETLDVNTQAARTTAEGTGDVADERATLAQLRHELAQDDREMRAATAELQQARRELDDAAHQMRASQASNAAPAPLHQANSGSGTGNGTGEQR